MNSKYELIQDDSIEIDGTKLYRIRALKDFRSIKTGDIGGYIEKEFNLEMSGDAWVFGDAWVVIEG